MDKNVDEQCFYSSDEDVAWGPITLREIKRDLRRSAKLDKKYRRQTVDFFPCSSEECKVPSIDVTLSTNRDYYTADETLSSNTYQKEQKMEDHNDYITCHDSSSSAGSCSDPRNGIDFQDEVIALSDEDEEYSDHIHVKTEKSSMCSYNFDSNSRTSDCRFESDFSKKDEVIYLSSSEDESVGGNEFKYDSEESKYPECPLITITSATPLKKGGDSTDAVSADEFLRNSMAPNLLDASTEDIVGNDALVQQVSSSESPVNNSRTNFEEILSEREECFSDDSASDDQYLLNDTIENMKRLLQDHSERTSDDENEEHSSHTSGTSINSDELNLQNTDSHSQYSGNEGTSEQFNRRNNFKVPPAPSKLPRKLPTPNKIKEIVSPSKFKSIVSPVRLYIKNSPHSLLKQNIKPKMVQSKFFVADEGANPSIQKTHKNIVETFPSVNYKPAERVITKFENNTIMPESIKKLIKERGVTKHVARTHRHWQDLAISRGNLPTLEEINISVHAEKYGLNK